ncbi:MAG: tetratricopeptide repeat protein [Deltaproteobacteria bacterium]|nr:tetratricopeptide repeat protein [Deltaproteobacteria bacterium]
MEEQIRNYQKILKANPVDGPAFNALEEIYQGQDRWRDLVGMYDNRLQQAQDMTQLKALLEKCGNVWFQKLGDLPKAKANYEQLLRLQPENRAALGGLEAVFSKRGDHKLLADVLEQQAVATEDSVERADLYTRLGHLYLEKIKRRDKALVAWGHALAADAKRIDVVEALGSVYLDFASFGKVLELLDRERELGVADDQLLGGRYLDLGRRLLEEPLKEDTCRQALSSASELLEDKTEIQKLLDELESNKANWEKRIKFLRVAAVEAPDKGRAVDLYRQIAEIYFLQGGHEKEVEDNLDKCALLQAGNPRLLSFIEQYYLQRRKPKEMLDRLNTVSTRIKEPRVATDLLERIAMLTAVHLQDRKASIEAYQRILKIDAGHSSAVASLVEYHQEEGRWAEVVDLLKAQVDRQIEPRAKAEALLQIAQITAEQLKDPEASQFMYEEILRLDSGNQAAAQALARIYEKAKDFNGLIQCLEILVEQTHDLNERITLLERMAEIHDGKREDPVAAFKTWMLVLSIDAGRKKVLKEVLALGEKTGRFQELAAALQLIVAKKAIEGKALLEVMTILAQTYETRLNQPDLASKVYQDILDVDESNMPALDALERLQGASGGSVELIGIYSKQLELVRSGEKKKELLFKLATIFQDRMADFKQAIDAYNQILELDDKEPMAWAKLAELYEQDGQWAKATEALEQSLSGTSDPERVLGNKYKLASIYEQRLNDTERALLLCSEILAIDQVPPQLAADTVTILERLQGRGVSPLRIAEILQPYYALSGDWRRHIDMLELRLEGCASPEERVQLLQRVAQVYEDELDQRELAFGAIGRAFRQLPEDEELLQQLSRLAAETGHIEDLALTVEQAMERSDDPDLVVSLSRMLAGLYRDQLKRPQNAMACLQRILGYVPDDRESLVGLTDLFADMQSWHEMVDVLRKRIEGSEDEAERKELMKRLAQVTEEELHDRPSAVAIFEQLHEEAGDQLDVLEALSVLLEKEGRWPDLAEVLDKMVSLVPQDEASELNLKLGRVRAERMEDREHAVEHYRSALAEKPDDERAVEGLESLLGRPDSAPAAAEILVPIYEQRSDWAGLARALEVRADIATELNEQVELYKRIAEIYERQLDEPERAFVALRQAFRADSSSQELLQVMQRLAEKSNAYEQLTAALEEAVSQEGGEQEQQVFLLQSLATLYRDVLKRSDLAASSLRRLLDVLPEHAATLATLESMYRESKSYKDLAWVLEKQAKAASDNEVRRDLLVQVAQVREEQLGDLEGAVAAFQQVFEMDSDDLHAAKQLDRLFQATNRWSDAAELLPRLAELSKNVIGVIEYNSRLAEIYIDRLDDPRRAVQILNQILGTKANHPETVALLERLLADERCRLPAAEVLDGVYRSMAEWRKLAAILEMRLAGVTDTAERMVFYGHLKDLYENRIGESALAFNVAARAFREQPQDEGARKDLVRLAEQSDFFDELVSVYQDVADRHVGTDLALALRKQIAWIEERHLNKRAEAISQWEKLLETNEAEPEVLSALERLYREEGSFEKLVGIYQRQVDLTEDSDQKKALLFQTAAALAEGVEDIDGAVVIYQSLLDIDSEDRRALLLLDQLLSADHRWADLAPVLEKEIVLDSGEPSEGSEERQLELLLRLAFVQIEKLDQPEGALGTLKAALALKAVEPRAIAQLESMLTDASIRHHAAELLEPAYRLQKDYRKLVAIMEVRLAGQEDQTRRLGVYQDLMRIYEEELSQKPLSFMVACRAFRENIEDDGIRQELERLAQETGSFEELAAVYEEMLPSAEGAEVGTIIGRRLAQLNEAHLQDKDEAVSQWRQVLANDPDDMEALKSLERLYRERASFSELVGILLNMSAMEEDLDQKKDILHEVATLMEERLGRNDGAIDAYREMLSEDPGDLAVLKLLDRLLEREGRHEELREVLESEIQRAATSELVGLKLRYAQLHRMHLGDPEAAVKILAGILEEESGQADAIAALVEMFDAKEAKKDVARILIQELDKVEDWKHLIAALESVFDNSEDLDERKAALLRIAGVYEQRLGQKELAFNVLGRAFQEDPTDERIRQALERLAEETEEFEMLAAVYSRRLDGLDDKTVVLGIHKRLARLAEESLGDQDRALESLKSVIVLDPADTDSLLALERLYRARQETDALCDVLGKRVKQIDDDAQASALLGEIALLHEQQGDFGGAIKAYRDLLERQPEDLNALRQLDRMCEQQGRRKDQAEVLIKMIGLLDAAGQIEESLDLRFRLGQIYETEFEDHDRAIQLYRDILKANPIHESTAQHLESMLGDGRSFDGAIDLLHASCESTGDWKKYLDILEGQVRQSRVMARRLELMEKIALVQEDQMGLAFMAFNTCVRMFHEDPANARTRERLERLADKDDNLEALAAVYEEELDNIEEPEVGASVALKVAKIQREQLEDEEEAIRFTRAALRFEPHNLKALAILEATYEEAENWDDLVDILQKEIGLVSDAEDRVRVFFKMGTILLERLEQASKSVGYFRQVLENDPEHIDSLKSLERAFAQQGEHESLHEVLKSRLSLTVDPAERIELVARVADLAAGVLNNPEEAVEMWQKILEEDPGSEDAFDALDRLYERTERWVDLASLIDGRMKNTADPELIAELSSRLGWVKGEKLGELEEAMENWQEVLRLDPKNAGALQALRRIYASGGQFEKLLGVLRKLVPLQEDMIGVKQIRFELAEILGEKLERRGEAIEAAKRALDIEPHSAEELGRLGRIFEANEAWQDAVIVLEQSAEQVEETERKVELLIRVAGLWRDKIGKALGAAPAYEKILGLDQSHEEAFRAAHEIYLGSKEWRRLTQLLETRLTFIRERRDRMELIKEIASIFEEHLGQKEMAFARYCAAFREDFTDDEVLDKLEHLAEETEDYDTLLEVLEDATSEISEGRRAVGLLQKIATLYQNRLGEPEKAEEYLRRAVQLDVVDTSSLEALAELHEEREQWEDLIGVLEKTYERSDELEDRKRLRRRISILQEDKLGRVDLAIESLRRILELDGRDGEAIQSLMRLYQSEDRFEDLISILRRAAEQAEAREDSVQYLFNIATVWESDLDLEEEAIDAYRDVLEYESSHLPSLQALERVYTRLDRWSELIGVFEKQVELVAGFEEKIKVLTKMGSIWEERFSNIENAAICHEQILDLDSKHLSSIKALERLVQRMGDYSQLIDLYYRHIDLVDEQQEIVDIHLAIGEVWYRELSRVDKAEDVFTRALEIDDQSREAMHALGQLYEKSGNWFNAIEMLSKEAEICGTTAEAVDLFYRMGKINEDMLLDAQAARDGYTRALAIDPSYLPAVKALKLIHYLDKEYEQYLEMMIQEAEHTEDVEEKTRLFYEIGKFLQEQQDKPAEAARYYEEALHLTADYLLAAKPLADIYFRSEQWEEAEQMMEVVVAGLDRNSEARELCRQYYRLGYITEKLSKEDRALEHYRMSYELDATYLPALEGLGNALIKTEQWEDAYRIYQTILIHHRDSLSDAEVAELYWQLGDVNFHMSETERAIQSFEKALEIDEGHLASLQYLVRIHEQEANWEESYDYGMQMVDSLDEDELFDHYLRLGDLCRAQLEDPFRAVDVLQSAMRLEPENLAVLTRLLDVYRDTNQNGKAVDILERLVQVEGRPSKLVEYHILAADLLRSEVRDDMRAVDHYNTALGIDPSSIGKAFQPIIEILRKRKDWPALKDNYIHMIKRLPVEARKTKLVLWKDLGELCRVVLRNLNESIDAYRMITKLDPDDTDALGVLGDLLAAKQGGDDEAAIVHHQVVAQHPDRIKSYRSLWKIYNSRKDYDKVYMITSVLRYLKKADEEEQKIVHYFGKKAPAIEGARPISDGLWAKLLAHPDAKVPFTRIFGVMYNMAAPMFIREHKELGLKRKEHQIDLARDRRLFTHSFRIAAKVMGGPPVELFAFKDQASPSPDIPGLRVGPTRPTSIVAYRDMFAADKKKPLLFYCGRQLAMTRPEFILVSILPKPLLELNHLLQAACLLVNPKYQAADLAEAQARARKLKRALDEKGFGILRSAVSEYLKSPKEYNLKRWVESVEHSVNRAGFVVCNDISVALGILRREKGWMSPMRPVTKAMELLKFASSPDYFKIREVMGLKVDA